MKFSHKKKLTKFRLTGFITKKNSLCNNITFKKWLKEFFVPFISPSSSSSSSWSFFLLLVKKIFKLKKKMYFKFQLDIQYFCLLQKKIYNIQTDSFKKKKSHCNKISNKKKICFKKQVLDCLLNIK